MKTYDRFIIRLGLAQLAAILNQIGTLQKGNTLKLPFIPQVIYADLAFFIG